MSRKTYNGFAFLFMMLFLMASPARVLALGTDITSISTRTISTPAATVNNVTGDNEVPFIGNVWTMVFEGANEFITELTFAEGRASIDESIPARVYLRRDPVTNARQNAIYKGTVDTGTNTINLRSFGPLTDQELLNLNNILMAGVNNIFLNSLTCGPASLPPPFCTGTSQPGTATTIERADFVLDQPVKAKKNIGFAVFELGVPTNPTGDPAVRVHDGFAIAAITSVDEVGHPTSYGPVGNIIAQGSWGKTPLVGEAPPFPHYYFLTNSGTAEGIADHPRVPINPVSSVPTNQTLGGVLIRADELLPSGEDIYGYSLFATDVTCTSETLVDISNPCFPKNTPGGGGGGVGGLDLAAANLGALHLKHHDHDKDKDK